MQGKSVSTIIALSVLVMSFTLAGEKITTPGHIDGYPADTSVSNTWIKVDSFDLSILPPSSGVQFYRDGIVYLSSTRLEEKMVSNHLSFGINNAVYAELADNSLVNQKSFASGKPFTYPCEAITFSGDYNTMYLTRYSKTDRAEKIYQAKYSSSEGEKGEWIIDESPLAFCADKYIYTHPALSTDGKLMVFSSNMPGSAGGMDLYATILKEGKWTDPVNLGDAVNSTSNEMYPFLDSENNLFFSSDGAQGFGGYDIYVCKFKSNTWERPINLASPVNTGFDDVAFTIGRKDGKTAFYTIKENQGKRAARLCRITMAEGRSDTPLSLSQYFTRPDISQMVILALEPAVQATDRVSETARGAVTDKDVITYRVQFMTSFNPRTRTQITVDGKNYPVYDYLYSGAYRLCVGEFASVSPAVELQNILRKGGYPNATVLAFRNNVISFEPELLKDTSPPTAQEKPAQPEVKETVAVQQQVQTAPPLKTEVEVKKTEAPPVTAQQTAPPKPAPVKTETQAPVKTEAPAQAPEKKDVVVYRVQILTNNTAKGSYKITIAGKSYDSFEYLYAGAYRTCVGEFNTLKEAAEFQKVCRANGHPQAFVVAFKNNVRSTDPALFK